MAITFLKIMFDSIISVLLFLCFVNRIGLVVFKEFVLIMMLVNAATLWRFKLWLDAGLLYELVIV